MYIICIFIIYINFLLIIYVYYGLCQSSLLFILQNLYYLYFVYWNIKKIYMNNKKVI